MRAFVAALVAVLVPLTASAMAGKEKTFGQGVNGEDRVKIADLVANPEAYVGQTVRVEGVVAKVQEKGGAFVELTDAGAVLRVDVNARKMSFPDDVKGKRVAVEGVFARRMIPAMDHGRADVARAAVHGKSDLPTGEHGKSEYAKAAEHGKSDLPTGEHGKSEYAKAAEHGKSAAAHAEKELKEKGEKELGEKAGKHEKAEKPEKAPHHADHPAAADTVVYELEGTGAILL